MFTKRRGISSPFALNGAAADEATAALEANAEEEDVASSRNTQQKCEAIYEVFGEQFNECLQCDRWGQQVEAVDGYERLARELHRRAMSLPLSSQKRERLGMTRDALRLRARHLLAADEKGPKQKEMEMLGAALPSVLVGDLIFPFSLRGYSDVRDREGEMLETPGTEVMNGGGSAAAAGIASSLRGFDFSSGPPTPTRDWSYYSIHIDRIGLKDAETYIDPYMVVSYANRRAEVVETQQTPVAGGKLAKHVVFNTEIHLHTPVEEMREAAGAIFFAFMHYKPRKQKKSCRCWAFMEMNELEDGEVVLELYHKPVDYQRRTSHINLHSRKPLFLHLDCRIRRRRA